MAFDLAQETEKTLEAFPHLAERTLFLQADVELNSDGLPPIYAGPAITPLFPQIKEEMVTAVAQSDSKGSRVWWDRRGDSGLRALIIHKGKCLEFNPDDIPAEKAMSRTFDHELGHMLVEGGMDVTSVETLLKAEVGADAYATIRLFQRYDAGEARHIAEHHSKTRALDYFWADLNHLTTTGIDRVLEDSRKIDFSKLTPQETVDMASHYAATATPDYMHVVQIKSVFQPEMASALRNPSRDNQDDLIAYARTCLASADDFIFHIGARAFQPLLQAEGMVNPYGQTVKLDEAIRTQLLDDMHARAREAKLDALSESLAALKQEILPRQPAAKADPLFVFAVGARMPGQSTGSRPTPNPAAASLSSFTHVPPASVGVSDNRQSFKSKLYKFLHI